MLGMDARDGRVVVDPVIPQPIDHLTLRGMHAFGSHYEIKASGTSADVGEME
jgi:hypothetical protein